MQKIGKTNMNFWISFNKWLNFIISIPKSLCFFQIYRKIPLDLGSKDQLFLPSGPECIIFLRPIISAPTVSQELILGILSEKWLKIQKWLKVVQEKISCWVLRTSSPTELRAQNTRWYSPALPRRSERGIFPSTRLRKLKGLPKLSLVKLKIT